ncbi:hypothetical protein HCJ07_10325 [Listeria booriae]|nr:hypothetical protein [Listeria booriae]MBC1525104.1 hypothetical protein [Listeria booriae]MBC1530739.1 hypothetical protein [Listeria booriae]
MLIDNRSQPHSYASLAPINHFVKKYQKAFVLAITKSHRIPPNYRSNAQI